MAWIIGNNPIINPGTGQCIKLNGSTILDLEKICADDVMVLPDRIGTGKTLYSYVKNNEGIDQSNRAVSYNSGSTDKVFTIVEVHLLPILKVIFLSYINIMILD